MGQTLSDPITDKETSALENDHYKVGSSCMQGWRVSMEDAHTHILRLHEDSDTAFFGVYDGHGGSKIALHASKNLHKFIIERPEYKEGRYNDALQQGFLDCDAAMRADGSLRDEMSGSTAITALIHNATQLYVANVGDSRCIASIDGVTIPLSVDHKPEDTPERKRIEKAGGYVEFSRVNGNLALSRALGDFNFKNCQDLSVEEQIVSAFPDVVSKTISPDWDFIVLACDGIWDILRNHEVSEFVIRRIASSMEPEDICEELMMRCLASDSAMAGLGCDNMSVIIVCFLHGKPYSELVKKCEKLLKTIDADMDATAKSENEDYISQDVPPSTSHLLAEDNPVPVNNISQDT